MRSTCAVRASIPKSAVIFLKRMNNRTGALMLERLDPAARARIEGATSTDWVPFADLLAIYAMTWDLLPREEFAGFWRNVTMSTFDKPLLKPFVESAVRLFGVSPATLVKMAGRIWPVITKDLGTMSAGAAAPGRIALTWSGLDVDVAQNEAFVHGMAGACTAFFPLTVTVGDVKVNDRGARTGTIELVFEWSEARAHEGPRA